MCPQLLQFPRSFAKITAAALALAISSLAVHAQSGRGYFVHLSSNTAPATTATIVPPVGGSYSAAAQTNTGTIWNEFPAVTSVLNPAGNIGNPKAASTLSTYALYAAPKSLVDSTGTASPVTVNVTITFAASNNDGISNVSQSGSSPNPAGLMGSAWRMQRGENSITYTISGLPDANAAYDIYFYGSGNATNQGTTLSLAPANVWGANPSSALSAGLATPVSVLDSSGNPITIGNGWNVLHGKTDGSGTLTIIQSKHTSGQNFMNGFQIVRFPLATITAQPPPTTSVVTGGNISIPVTATINGTVGITGTLTYQWRKDGVAINTTTNPSAATATLQLTGATNADQGSYDVIVTTEGGPLTSSACALSISSSAVAPAISSQPVSQTASVNGAVTFSVVASGTAPLTYTWQKSNDNVAFTDIPNSNVAQLQIASAQTSDAGYYRVKVQNSVPPVATSNAVTLTVKPVLTSQPVSTTATAGSAASLSVNVDVGAGAPEPTTFVWKFNGVTVTNGSGISGATSATLQFASFSTSSSGYYTVTASNSAGSATSNVVYLGTATTQSVTFAPGNNATGINPDAPLVVRFPSAPRVGDAGSIVVRKSSDNSIVETIDLGALTPFTNASVNYRYSTKTVGGQAGYKYFPVLIVGNEARITLKSGSVLQYGTSYYLTIEPGAILDSTGATLPAITGSSGWTFATKAAAPSAIPTQTTFTVASDGSGDFSTLQGALDFIPTSNTTPVRINLRNGTYEEIVNYGSRNKITLVGENRDQTIVEYPNNAPLNSDTTLRVSFFSKGNDLVIANLTINNSTPKGGGQAEALRSDGLRNCFLGCTIKSFQDTLLLGADNYFQDCLIQGDTDFIWGGGTAMFKNCELRSMNGGDLTQSRTPFAKFGFVFVDCTLTRPSGSTFAYTLGRTSADASSNWGNAAFIDCRMDAHISAAGWSASFISVPANARNWEYQSKDLTGATLVDVSQRASYSRQLTSTEAAILRLPANVYGNVTNSTASSPGVPANAAGDGWVPAVGAIIHNQPASQTVNAGQQVTFSLLANAAPAPTYQWYKGANAIPGATGSSLVIASAAAGDAADYSVTLTNATTTVTSSVATLTVTGVTPAPVFSTHPASQTINVGASATFTAAASGSPTYQWKKDTVDIPGAVSASYTVSGATTGSAGSYTVVATNAGGSTTSNAAVLTVTTVAAPVFSTHPASQTVNAGTSVTFTAAASGSPTYQWKKDNVDISGATSASYTIASTTTGSAGSYTVVATNAGGSTTSNAATLTVTTLPAAPVFSTHPASQTVNAGTSVTFTAAASGSPTYQWKKDNVDISGATSASYTIASTTTGSAGSYTVVATNAGGSTTSNAAVLTISTATAPVITTQPAATQSVSIGASASFTVVATGTATLTYQWQKSDSGIFVNIPGATSATFTIASAQLASAGIYRVIVTNSAGSATSNTSTLTVNSPNFAITGPDGFAASATGGGSLTPIVVTTAAAFKTAVESNSPAVITVSGTLTLSGGKVDVRSNKTIQGADGLATIIGCLDLGSGSVTNVIIRGLNITHPGTTLDSEGKYTDGGDGITVRDSASNIFITHCTLFDCADGMIDINNLADNVTVSWCEFYYTPAQTNHRFTMIVGSAGAETRPLRITLHHNWWSDRCDQRMPSGTFGYVHLFNNYFTATGNSYATNARVTSQFFVERSVYIGVKDPMYKEGGGLMRAIENVFTSTTGQVPDAGTDVVFTPPYSYKLQPTSGSSGLDVATLVAANAGNTAGLNSVSPVVLSATITGPAAGTGTSVPAGSSATLTSTFTGFTATSYQWRLNNLLITGATASTYAITNMDSAKTGAYTVAITLSTGETVISTPFAVTLGTATAPTITTQPVNVTVTAGAAASFTVAATSDTTLSYQWRKAGTNIAGATAATYSIASTSTADAAQYTVVVTNAGGSVTSNAATLTVNTPAAPTSPSPPPASGGGGGAPSLWFMAALALLATLRRSLRRS